MGRIVSLLPSDVELVMAYSVNPWHIHNSVAIRQQDALFCSELR